MEAPPSHWGRCQGLATRLERPPIDRLLANVFFDTCVCHTPGVDLLARVIPNENVRFASETIGAVRGTNPETGSGWEDTKRYVDGLGLPGHERRKVFEEHAPRVYSRLGTRLGQMV